MRRSSVGRGRLVHQLARATKRPSILYVACVGATEILVAVNGETDLCGETELAPHAARVAADNLPVGIKKA